MVNFLFRVFCIGASDKSKKLAVQSVFIFFILKSPDSGKIGVDPALLSAAVVVAAVATVVNVAAVATVVNVAVVVLATSTAVKASHFSLVENYNQCDQMLKLNVFQVFHNPPK